MIDKTTKTGIILPAAMLASYIIFAISTITAQNFAIRLFSPVAALFAVLVILANLGKTGEFERSSMFYAVGITMWTIADIVRFLTPFFTDRDPLGIVVRTLYLMPNYFFGIGLFSYILIKLEKRDVFKVLMDTFALTVAGVIVVRKVFDYILGGLDLSSMSYFRMMLYMVVNLSIIIMVINILYMIGIKDFFRGANVIPVAILCYIILDFQYTYLDAAGQEAENIYTDLFYMLFMMLIAFGVWLQAKEGYEYHLKQRDFNEFSLRIRRMLIIAVIGFSLVLYVIGVFNQSELFYLLIAMMAYWIMAYTLQNSLLSEKILEQQKNLNKTLEKQVEEKTQDLMHANENLLLMSSTDQLTKLYNRRHGNARLKELTRGSEKKSFSVMCIDLNHFKPINDTYGHEMGDRVLVNFGERMLALPEGYTCVRTGGDEFMILDENVSDKKEAAKSAARIQALFDNPVILDTYIFKLSGSIGVSFYPDDSEDPEQLVQYADAAMYSVKKSSKRNDYRFYDKGLIATVGRRRRLEEKLKKCDPEKDFIILYQPQYDVETVEITGFEAFPRFRDEEMSGFSPAEIIPVAEELGMMNALGSFIAKAALTQLYEWSRVNKQDKKDSSDQNNLTMTINLSALQLIDADFIELLVNLTAELSIKPSHVILDISNSVMLGAASSAKDTLKALCNFGFLLSLNDFGGGDICISYILECGFSCIKLAHDLVKDDNIDDPDRKKLISSILAMAESLGVVPYAIEIETRKQRDCLKEMGIRRMQGFLFGKPVPAEIIFRQFLSLS